MDNIISCYEKIQDELKYYKVNRNLIDKSDDYAFSALCIDSIYYQNLSNNLYTADIPSMVVDGKDDNGIDILLRDPNNTETTDLIIGQSKFWQKISADEIRDAIHKMIDAYNNLSSGRNGTTKQDVIQKFTNITADMGDESKVHFIFVTSAPQNHINTASFSKIFTDSFSSDQNVDFQILFGNEVDAAIRDKKSRRDSVEKGKLILDGRENVLSYNNDEAAIVNISAYSLKNLFEKEGKTLLAKNLRYYIRKRDIDDAIKETILTSPDYFWFRNNGITIICDSFELDGPEVKLTNFSIVNGGQTTAMISKGSYVNEDNDFFLPCKIIKCKGNNEEERAQFSLDIAKATNSQKPIKQSDLKANSPEQIMFVQDMRNVGIYYQTKRGEKIEKGYTEDYKNTDLPETGKLCLAGLFQLPCSARNHPSIMYQDMYYNVMFNKDNEARTASFVKDLLYINYYFGKGSFKKKFANKYEDQKEINSFANNARTLCVAFACLARRLEIGNITDDTFATMRNPRDSFNDFYHDDVYSGVRDISSLKGSLFGETTDQDKVDDCLYTLFTAIIFSGYQHYCVMRDSEKVANESNYLKLDVRYYQILRASFPALMNAIKQSTKDLSN